MSEIIHCTHILILSREEKGGNTASQKATSIAAVGLFVLRVRVRVSVVTIVWVLDSSSFQNRRRRGGGGIYNDNTIPKPLIQIFNKRVRY